MGTNKTNNRLLAKGSAALLCGAFMALGANANAIMISFTNLNLVNTTGNAGQVLAFAPGPLTGTLTSVSANFIIEAGQTGGVWASDFGVFITNGASVQTLANGGTGVYQAGGFNLWGSSQYSAWGTGNSGTAGTAVVTTLNLANPIVFNGNAGDPSVFLAHLWNSNSQGTWTGSITLNGVVPEPATIVFLSAGLAVLALRRRRNSNA